MEKKGVFLLFFAFSIFSLGLLMVFDTTSAEILDRSLEKNTHYALIRQILYAIVGFMLAAGIWSIGYNILLKLSGPILIFFSILLVLVFIPGIGLQINGAHRWLNIFGNSFQPSEFVKFFIPIYYISASMEKKNLIDLKAFLKLMVLFCIPIGLILIEPDNGTVAIILASLIALFLLTKLKWTYWALPLMIIFALGAITASQMKHVHDRIHIYLHPEADLQGKGHQPYQAKIAAGSGKLWGRGLGESLQKLNYLPEARSDYIAAIYAEEFGFVGILGLIFLYSAIGFCGYSIAVSAKDAEGFYLASIITFLICFQAFLNLGVVSGLLPSKGTNLPLFSQGGSSLLSNFMAIALLLNVHRSSVIKHA